MAYNTDPNVQTLAKSVTQAGADIKAQIWVRSLQLGAQQNDDFSIFEGPDEGEKPVYVRQDLTKDGGDKMTFTVMGGLAGNGVRGENELTGNTSRANFKTFDVILDFWRDGFELSKKQRKFMAAGGDLPAKASMLLRNKLGLKKQRDAMISLRQQASGNTIRPNGRLIQRILRVGIPAGIENGMFQIGKLSVASLTSTLGTAAIAANAVANTTSTFLNIPASAV